MQIDFLFDTKISKSTILVTFKKILGSEKISFISSETSNHSDYLLDYKLLGKNGLMLSATLCGYESETVWNMKAPVIFNLAEKLSAELNICVYIYTSNDCQYEMIRIEPNGNMFGGNEMELEIDSIAFESIKLLNNKEIKKIKSILLKSELAEKELEMETQLEFA